MTLAAIGTDLVLFGRVVAHPRRHWSRWHALVRDLFGCGGVTIDTPPAGGDEVIWVRTVIQPDGDVLVLVHEDHVTDDVVLAMHQQRVSHWYEEGQATVRQALVTLRVLIWGLSATAAASLGSVTSSLVRWEVGLLVGGALLPFLRWLFGFLANDLLQGRIEQVLHQVGVADLTR